MNPGHYIHQANCKSLMERIEKVIKRMTRFPGVMCITAEEALDFLQKGQHTCIYFYVFTEEYAETIKTLVSTARKLDKETTEIPLRWSFRRLPNRVQDIRDYRDLSAIWIRGLPGGNSWWKIP